MVTKRTTGGLTPRRRTTGRRTTSRRTTSGYRTRRRSPRTANTLGGAFALGLIALFTKTGWPVRIGIVVVALAAVAVYLVLRARRSGAGPEPVANPEPVAEPAAGADSPAAPIDPKDAPS